MSMSISSNKSIDTQKLVNKDIYKVKQLEELGEIKKQVISLSLAKLPVKNEDFNKFFLI